MEQTLLKFKSSQLSEMQKHFGLAMMLILWFLIPSEYLNLNIINHFKVLYILLIFLFIALVQSSFHVLTIASKSYELTSERLLIYYGIMNRVRKQIELYRVKDIEVFTPLYLRAFELSNIKIIYTLDNAEKELIILAVKDGYKKMDMIRENVEIIKQQKRVIQYSN